MGNCEFTHNLSLITHKVSIVEVLEPDPFS